eukprot:TRINITY_DN585_c0_g1_i11.p1 TRINITY_DN585_c0_g1~~TRINITY_DN585_c0_g1_i11.p1  ORF type:complete len:858 (+),score=327.18 TRINITY_DN585_c0_g1_i11:105-2678(+)
MTDHEYTILGLVRTHTTEDAKYAVRATYPTTDIQLFRPMTRERMEEAFKAVEEGEGNVSLKTAFTNSTEYGPAFVEHCLLNAGARPNFKKAGAADTGRKIADTLLDAFKEPDAFLRDVPEPKGYLIRRLKADEAASASTAILSTRASAEAYEDFAPVLYKQHQAEGLQVEKFDTFNEACDYYFSAVDQSQVEQHNEKSKKAALTKVEKALANHRRRIEELEKEQNVNLDKALLIETHIDDVEAALSIIRSAVGRAVDWTELARIVKEQKRLGNPIASIIHELKLEKNKVSLLLQHPDVDEDGNSEVHVVDVDISLSAHANARTYFGAKKKIQEKQVKTQAAEGKAIASASRKAEKQTKKKTFEPKKDILSVRKVLWFEKFNWFISSENYLVLAGRDAQQNELLVKRYLKKGDIYVHADIHGAASTIIKNPTSSGIPPDTLYQAGNMAVCRSSAWESNIVISAWWVHHNQVSKTAPSGESMPTGAFMIRGKKNFLPPTKLQMGAALIFRVHDEHAKRHVGERMVMNYEGGHEGDETSSVGAPTQSVAPSICAASEAPSSIHCNKNLMERYGLHTEAYTETGAVAEAPELDDPSPDDKPQTDVVSKPRMSAKERRMKKKASKQTDGDEALQEGEGSGAEKPKVEKKVEIVVPEESERSKKKVPQAPLSRGEKRKAKKQAKYKDQDDDEKELKMRLCGWKGVLKNMKLGDEEEEEEEEEKKVEIREFQQDGAFKQDVKRPYDPNEVKEVSMELDVIDTLTGKPFEDDLILHPMLMVGPVEAVEEFKFRVNVLPGKDKKGKAAQQLLHHFSQSIIATEQERELIKHMDMQDCINLLPSNLRIVTDADLAKKATGTSKKSGR